MSQEDQRGMRTQYYARRANNVKVFFYKEEAKEEAERHVEDEYENQEVREDVDYGILVPVERAIERNGGTWSYRYGLESTLQLKDSAQLAIAILFANLVSEINRDDGFHRKAILDFKQGMRTLFE